MDELSRKKVKVLISNASHSSIEGLYEGYEITAIDRPSCISGNINSRKKVSEFIIKNY